MHTFPYDNGTYTDIKYPGSTGDTYNVQLNDAGEVAGNYSDSTGSHIFLYKDGTYQRVDPPGASQSGPEQSYTSSSLIDLNNRDQILGSYYISSPGTFLYSNGTSTDVSVAGASSSSPTRINDLGQLIGTFYDGSSSNAVLATPVQYEGSGWLPPAHGSDTVMAGSDARQTGMNTGDSTALRIAGSNQNNGFA